LDRTSPGILRKIEASKPWFERFSVLAVILEPGAVVCLLAGWSKMRAATFWSVNVFGTLARVLLVRRIGVRVSEWSAFAKASKFAKANRRVIAVAGFAIATAAAMSVLRGLKKAYAAEKARTMRKREA
jgi:membrane protein DedA with SNARE-associated domain